MRFFMCFLLTLMIADVASAYNHRRCKRYLNKESSDDPGLKYFTSTAQFFTSTSDCRLIGGVENKEREVFYVNNFEKIQQDVAQAKGEYLDTFLTLYGCGIDKRNRLGSDLQRLYPYLFDEEENSAIESSFPRLHGHLLKGCQANQGV